MRCRQSPLRDTRQPTPAVTQMVARSYTTSWDAIRQFRMAPPHLVEDSHSAQTRPCLQHRNNLCLPDAGQRVWTAPTPRHLLLRRQARIGDQPISAGCADPGLRRSDWHGVGLVELHEKPHLAVGDMAPRQSSVPQKHGKTEPYPDITTAKRTLFRARRRRCRHSGRAIALPA